jgi:hypothetical protein
MTKAAITVLERTGSRADRGRAFGALEATKGFVENGDEVELIFDGAGTEWIAELNGEDHGFHGVYSEVAARSTSVASAPTHSR